MHDTNTDLNDVCGTEECNIVVIDPEFASREAQVLQRGGPSAQDTGPQDMISALRMAALHIWVGCLFHQTYGNSV